MIGSRQWMEHSQGKLTLQEKYKIIQSCIAPMSYKYAERFFEKSILRSNLDLHQIIVPNTPIVQQALLELSNCGVSSMIQHAWRSFYWAIALAEYQQWHYDAESLLLACLMHNIGLTDALLPEHCHCFSYASALKAEKLCHSRHYPESKTLNISNAICLHINGNLSQHKIQRSHEVLLLQQAVSCDVMGSYLACIPLTFQQQVLKQHPRQHFNREINQLYQREARRNPDSRCALLRRFGLALMIKFNGFEQ